MGDGASMQFRFDGHLLDVQSGRLHCPGGGVVPLRPLVLRTLQLLLSEAPSLVSRDRLLDEVWGRREVSESVIAQVIRDLRQILADDAKQPRVLETRPRLGYRICVDVERVGAPPSTPAVVSGDSSSGSSESTVLPSAGRRWRWALAMLPVLALLWFVWQWSTSLSEASLSKRVEQGDAKGVLSALSESGVDHPAFRAWALLHDDQLSAAEHLASRLDELDDEQSRRISKLLTAAIRGHWDATAEHVAALRVWRPDDSWLLLWLSDLDLRLGAARQSALSAELQGMVGASSAHRLLLAARANRLNGQVAQQAALATKGLEESGMRPAWITVQLLLERAHARIRLAEVAQAGDDIDHASSMLADIGGGAPLVLRQQLWLFSQRLNIWLRAGADGRASIDLQQLAQRAEQAGDAWAQAEIARLRGVIAGVQRETEDATKHLQIALSGFKKQADLRGSSLAALALSNVQQATGEITTALETIRQAERWAGELGADDLRAPLHGSMAVKYWQLGDVTAAGTQFDRALAAFQRLGSRLDVAQVEGNLASVRFAQGATREAERLRQQSIQVAREGADRRSLAYRLTGSTAELDAQGRFDEADAALVEAGQLWADLDDNARIENNRCLRARRAWMRDDLRVVSEDLRHAEESSSRAGRMDADCVYLAALTADDRQALVAIERTVDDRLSQIPVVDQLETQAWQRIKLVTQQKSAEWPAMRQLAERMQAKAEAGGDSVSARDAAIAIAHAALAMRAPDSKAMLNAAREQVNRYPARIAQWQVAALEADADTDVVRQRIRREKLADDIRASGQLVWLRVLMLP